MTVRSKIGGLSDGTNFRRSLQLYPGKPDCVLSERRPGILSGRAADGRGGGVAGGQPAAGGQGAAGASGGGPRRAGLPV